MNFSFTELGEELIRLDTNRKIFSQNSSSFEAANATNKLSLKSLQKGDIFVKSTLDDKDIFTNYFLKNNNFKFKTDTANRLTPILFNHQSNEFLDTSLSPKSVESPTSCRSHDGVFLRPDAISNQNSPISTSASTTPIITALLSHRLTKLTSVDSGINIDQSTIDRPTLSRAKTQSREQQLRLNQLEQSMSLPVSNASILAFNSSNSITTAASQIYSITAASPNGLESTNDSYSLSLDSAIDPHSFFSNGSNTSLNNTSLLSPTRRMDFALCK